MNTTNAISYTKAYFYPHLESKKGQKWQVSQSETSVLSFRAGTNKTDRLEDSKKLEERALRAKIDKSEVLKIYNCLDQLIQMQLLLNEGNIETLGKIVEKEYPIELKPLKVSVLYHLACFIHLKSDAEERQQLIGLAEKSFNHIQGDKYYEENPGIDNLGSTKELLTAILKKSGNLQMTIPTESSNVETKVKSILFLAPLFLLFVVVLYFVQFKNK